MRQHEVERGIRERQRHAVGQREMQVPHAALVPEPHARVLEAFGGIDAHDRHGLLGERERHPAAAAARIEHAAADRDAGPLEKRDDFRAAVVLEQRVVVLRSKPYVGVRLDGALVNPAHLLPWSLSGK
jgi:hypothetical protein